MGLVIYYRSSPSSPTEPYLPAQSISPPRGKNRTVDAQVALNLIQEQGIVQLVTPGDNFQCALYAVAIGLRSENYTAPLNFDDSSTQESMCFDQLLHYIAPVAPPRGKNRTVDAQVALNLIQEQGIVQLVTPGDNFQCALYAVAIGLRSENYTAPLNFDDSSTQESMCFDQLLHYIAPVGE
ncbi:hypothetical protein JADG_004573 [Aureobasidium aubasidani]|nr:hypothetical protein JADG_004573 [Aureobasidium pullulans]